MRSVAASSVRRSDTGDLHKELQMKSIKQKQKIN